MQHVLQATSMKEKETEKGNIYPQSGMPVS